jgi:hypothetical protein
VADALAAVAHDHHAADPDGPSAARIEGWLGALVPRAMCPGGWTQAARLAGAEPLVTGRVRAYDESTLRRAADRLDAAGCSARVAQAMWCQVDRAVNASGEEVIAYTDMFDQPYYTKKLAHAAPIGRLGNRLLAGVYFGVTTVALANGPTLFLHLSWHKPAAPLHDGLVDLLADPARLAWWHEHVWSHIWDRGGNGDRTLALAWAWEIPYLTISPKSADLWRFHAATMHAEDGRPLVFRPDPRLGGTLEDGPWEAIVPASPDKPESERGIRFRSAIEFGEEELRGLTVFYKSRWPEMENQLKAVIARGFGRNRTRSLEMTTSRGVDGAVERAREQEIDQLAVLKSLTEEAPSGKNITMVLKTARKIEDARRAGIAALEGATLKNARTAGGSERLAKQLHLLTHNALTIALHGSDDEEVRVMDPNTVFALLLDRPAVTCIENGRLTMWVEAIGGAADRRRQAALVETFNGIGLRCRGCAVTIRMRRDTAQNGG